MHQIYVGIRDPAWNISTLWLGRLPPSILGSTKGSAYAHRTNQVASLNHGQRALVENNILQSWISWLQIREYTGVQFNPAPIYGKTSYVWDAEYQL